MSTVFYAGVKYTKHMEETLDSTQINQSVLQSLLGDSDTSLIPESLVTTLTVGFIILNVIAVLFLVFYIVSLIRKWKVESAVLHMQKDLAEIKAAIAKPQAEHTATPASPAPSNNPVIATNDDAQKPPLT
jgi:hypothetical protein